MAVMENRDHHMFHLQTKDTSYVLQIVKNGYLAHVYWGKKVQRYDQSRPLRFGNRAFSPNPDPQDQDFSLDTLPQEYPAYGNSDFRAPAFQVQREDGSTITDLRYAAHRIIHGKPKLAGLPATYAEAEHEAETLEIDLIDELTGLTVTLSYSVFAQFDAITRSVRFVNAGKEKLRLLRALSMNVDLPDADFELLHLSGAWARERGVVRRKIAQGSQSIESRRGASSHQHNPFAALVRPGTGEDHGEVYAVNLVYSGNFLAQVEVDQFASTRLAIGINPFDFSWLIESGESFQTPEAVMVYSDQGLGKMSRTFHRLYRSRLCRGVYRDKERPILVNNWEATYFDFNAEKIRQIAGKGKELGIELFVLDDGWFGNRDDDKRSLGDWFVNRRKLPEGLDGLAGSIEKMGMRFGLWFEPEMISEDSELYRKHPDWCLHVPGRTRSTGRNQLVLDFSREDVCDAITRMVSDVLASAPISYVKWDMNRHMTEVGSATLPPERQRETAHRYMLGLYRVLENITSAFPHVLFESCSGGGGRFDPGMLYYMPQTWTSDNTDAVSRILIQYGTSMVYPASAMGAHVSAVPNHQLHRVTSLQTRGHVASSGNFGYELDLTKMTEEEQQLVKQQVAFYKEVRRLVQFGDFYRLLNPYDGPDAAWMFVSEDRREAFVAYFRLLAAANPPFGYLRLKGLDPNVRYRVNGSPDAFGGDELMYAGLNIPELNGDFQSVIWRLQAEQ
ncbi:MAG TPA: alpha-galactosidase [Bacilli bacterium]